jgi:hypothetical protein
MHSQLDAFRRRLWMIKIGEGILAGLFGLLMSYALVFVLDRFGETPAMVRGGLLLVGTAGFGVALPLILHRWVWGTRRLEQIARLIRRRFPRLGDQLLGIVELAQSEQDVNACSDDLLRAAVAQVDDRISTRQLDDAVPTAHLRRWVWAVGGVTTLAMLVLLVTPAAGFNAMARWLMPWRDMERYTFAQLESLPDELVVPYAEEFHVRAMLDEATAWRPSKGEARFGEEPSVTADLNSNEYLFTLPPRKEPHRLAVAVGDARHEIDVQPMQRPELTEILSHVKLPDYLQYPEDLTQDVRGGTTSVVAGSFINFEVSATRELEWATMDGRQQRREGATIVTEPRQVTESFAVELDWRDAFGLGGKRPLVLTVQAREDEPPSLACEGGQFEQVLLEDDVLTFQLNARDDFGVKSVGMVWAGIESPYRNPHPSAGERPLMTGKPQVKSLASEATFSPRREGIHPQTVKLRMYAVDYLPDRERIYSPEFIVHILSPEEHNIWLTRQLSRWFRTATEVYDKERMLNDQNVALRGMTPEELDRSEIRRRVEQQAAAEQANARKLDSVAASGKQLIREALKNDEFNPATLETWAQMLHALQEIADQRMPSVAELLADAAKAPAGKADHAKSAPRPVDPQPASDQQQAKQNPRAGNDSSEMPGKPGAPKTGEVPRVPQIADVESGFNKPSQQQQENKEPSPAKAGRLTLPTTTLMGGGPPPDPQEQDAPVGEMVAQAVEEQQDLLDEFARVADELQRILDNLEGSTFVKRFKAVSRRELELAADINTTMVANFGVPSSEAPETNTRRATKLADRQRAQSDAVWLIQSDLKAYFNRVRDGKFKVVLDEMSEENPVGGLAEIAQVITANRSGQAVAGTEYWADTLDRWAEQLVGPACKCNGQCPPGNPDSLPPQIVLAIMRILEKEINLREETRTTEQAREAMEASSYNQRADSLSETQEQVSDLVLDAIDEIEQLDTAASFVLEVALLTRVHKVMAEAAGILARPDTGPDAIAAETEAIELLLQAKRCNPNGGGGGGTSPGGGSGGDTNEAALALLGDGDERQAHAKVRSAEQATGVAGQSVPAEFRSGLDAFFGALEGTRQRNE